MYAPAKRAYIFHDSYSFLSRGYGVVEFDRVESAIHTLSFANNIAVRGIQVRIGYANPQCVREAHNSVSTSTPFFPPTLPATLPPSALYGSNYPAVMNYPSMATPMATPMVPPMVPPMVLPTVTDGFTMSDGRPFPSNYKTHVTKWRHSRGLTRSYVFDARSGLFFEPASRFYYCQSRDMVDVGVWCDSQYLDSVTFKYYFLSNHQLIPYTPQPPPLVEESEVAKDGGSPSQPLIPTPVSNPLIATPVCPSLPPPPKPVKSLFAIKLDPGLAARVNNNPPPPAPPPPSEPASRSEKTQSEKIQSEKSHSEKSHIHPASTRQPAETKTKARAVQVPTLAEAGSRKAADP